MDAAGTSRVSCNLCGSDRERILFQKDSFNIVKCGKCGLVYVNPRLDGSELSELYNKNKISPVEYYVQNTADDEKTFRERAKKIKQFKDSGVLLEVGCGVGTFLKELKKAGFNVYGIDINKSAVEYCKSRNNLGDVTASSFEEGSFKKESFDVIVMNDVLEHTTDPSSVLKTAYGLLKKDGLIFITTPDVESLTAKLSGSRWLHFKPDEHLYYFSPKTLRQMLEQAGFSFMEARHVGRFRSLEVIFLKSQTYTTLFYRISKLIDVFGLSKRLSLKVNVFDEMMAVAGKK
ncbi:MAG: class I SAM-dependent methyltransferase [Candidatus Altiarchaeota archaeon]|nr:class I SAM-dependent methyltransferase [Candidatus Altiarchaeota archaeon]